MKNALGRVGAAAFVAAMAGSLAASSAQAGTRSAWIPTDDALWLSVSVPCGRTSETCCQNSTCDYYSDVCWQDTCQACGGVAKPCCAGSCNADLTCNSAGICEPVYGQARQALNAADVLPAACLLTAAGQITDPFTCFRTVFAKGKEALNVAKSILAMLGLTNTGPTLDDKLAGISEDLATLQDGVASLHTQVADLNATITGYATQNIKTLVWNRVSELRNLHNDLQFVRAYGDLTTRAEVIRYTNNLAEFLTNDVLYQDGPDASLNYHTPMYTGMGLIEAVVAFATAIEVEASSDPFAWQRYAFRSELSSYASALRKVSGYAAEWANANVTLTLENDSSGYSVGDAIVPITRPCPTGSLVVECGYFADYVGKHCACRYPQWELKFNGVAQRTYNENLAEFCLAPSKAREANPCLAYSNYRAKFEAAQAEFRQQVGVQDYLDAAALVDAYVSRNTPAP